MSVGWKNLLIGLWLVAAHYNPLFASIAEPLETFLTKSEWLVKDTRPTEAKYSVFIFLSPICPCSQHHEKEISTLPKEFPGVHFIGVYSGSDAISEQKAKLHFEKSNLGFGVLRDPELKLANHFKAARTPHAFIVDEKGDIFYQGGVDDKRTSEPEHRYLKDALTAVLAGKTVENPATEPLGCRIQR